MITAKQVKELRDLTGAGMLDCKKALEASDGNVDAAIDWLREKGISKAAGKQERIAAEGLSTVIVDGNKAVVLEINTETDFVAKNEEFQTMVKDIANTILNSDATSIEEAEKLVVNNQTIGELLVAKTAKIGEKLAFRRFDLVVKSDDQVFGAYVHMGGKISVLLVASGGAENTLKDVAMHVAAMRPKYISANDMPASDVEHERKVLTEQAINEGKSPEIATKMVEGRIKKYYQEVCLLEQSFVKDSDKTVGQVLNGENAIITKMIRYEVGEGLEKRQCENCTTS